jgi:3-methylcrotonyl-CoA carboxylase beta subunit
LLYTNSTNTVPVVTVLLRKAPGAGYYAMNGRPYEPIVQLSTPLTRLAVMEGRTLAIGTFRTRLDDDFNIVAANQEEYDAIKKGLAPFLLHLTTYHSSHLSSALQAIPFSRQ